MVNGAAAQPLKASYGPVTFLAALANILIVEIAVWWFLPWFLQAIYVLPLLVVDVVVAAVLKSRPGTMGQIGRGMLIGLIAAPAAVAIFWPGLMLVQALGLV